MARIRSVKPEICESETMASLTAAEERTFVRLWTHLDDEGRAKDDVRLIKAALFPLHDDVTPSMVDAHLAVLAARGLLVRYAVTGKRYLACPSWHEHQHPQKPRPSKLPSPNDADEGPVRPMSRTTTGHIPEGSGPVVVVGGVEVVVGVGVENTSPIEHGTALELVTESMPSAAPKQGQYPLDFEEFWKLYPRKTGKGAAAKAYRKARAKLSAGSLLAALDVHVAAWRQSQTDAQFIPHPATWLNEARYDDPPPQAAPRGLAPSGGPSPRSARNNATIEASLARALAKRGEVG